MLPHKNVFNDLDKQIGFPITGWQPWVFFFYKMASLSNDFLINTSHMNSMLVKVAYGLGGNAVHLSLFPFYLNQVKVEVY